MKFLTPINLNQNELQNGVWQNLASDPGSPLVGQFWFNTTAGRPKIRLSGSSFDLTDSLTLGGQNSVYYLGRGNHTGTQLASTISDFNTAVRINRIDQLASAGADMALGGFKITGLAAASAATDAVNYSQLLAVQNGTTWKDKVLVATTANISLTGEQTIDGVATSASRVLVKNQTTSLQNGIYVSTAGAWARSSDMAPGINGANVTTFVEQGTTQADTQWTCTSNTGSAVVASNSLAFAQIGSSTSYTADGTTLTLTGTVFSINSSYIGQNTITTLGTINTGVWSGTTIAVNKGGTGATTSSAARANLGAIGKYSALIGDGVAVSITITQATHGLAVDGTNSVTLYEAASGVKVFTDVTVAPASGNVTLLFSVAPTSNQFRVVIVG